VKLIYRFIPILVLTIILVSCGYHNPNVYSGPAKSIYIAEWENRTSELSLSSKIYRTLMRWYQKSSSISVVRKKAGADLILAGEIVSIDLPSLSYGIDNTATEVKARLRVRYILKEISTNTIILEVPEETWTEAYLIGSNSTDLIDNEEEALNRIIENLSQKIYQTTVSGIPKL
jgi:hypothetical protein